MAVLDSMPTPDPANTSYRDLAIRYGAIWGGTGIFLTLIGYLTNTDAAMPSTSGAMKALYSLISVGVAIWAIVTVIRMHRDEQLGGFIGLGRCVGIGSLTGLVASVIGAIFFAIYTSVINTGFSEQIQEAMIAQWEAQGMSETQIEQAMSMSSMFTSPAFMALSQMIGGVLIGLIIGLIAGLVMKRELPIR